MATVSITLNQLTGRDKALARRLENEIREAAAEVNALFDELGVRAVDAVMIGDTSFDLEMAGNAGCRGIGVLSGGQRLEHLAPHRPVAVLASVRELPDWLAEPVRPLQQPARQR